MILQELHICTFSNILPETNTQSFGRLPPRGAICNISYSKFILHSVKFPREQHTVNKTFCLEMLNFNQHLQQYYACVEL